MGRLSTLAKAIEAELKTSCPVTPVEISRRPLPVVELEALKGLHLVIIPRSRNREMASREDDDFTIEIDVAVHKHLERGDQVELDALTDQVEEIAAFLSDRPLADDAAARWMDDQIEPVWAPDHLAEHNVFSSVIRLTYLVSGTRGTAE